MRFLLTKQLSAALRSVTAATSSATLPYNRQEAFATCTRWIKCQSSVQAVGVGLLDSPWSATQLRRARFSGADVKPGNHIKRKGKIYEVIKAHHTTQGRGGAIIQVEFRDVDSGNKVNERLRTDEPVEKIFVQERILSYLYTDDETGEVVLMEDKTYEQLEVPGHLFGDSIVFLQDEMKVTVRLFDGRPLSVSIPTRVTCKVAEAAEAVKGRGPTPYKSAVLDNGVTVQVPAHILAEDEIVINTTDNTYCSRA